MSRITSDWRGANRILVAMLTSLLRQRDRRRHANLAAQDSRGVALARRVLDQPGGPSRNEICVVAKPFVHSGARPRSIGSMCDCPSEPVKSRNVPIALLPFPWSKPMGWGLTTTRFENLAGCEKRVLAHR